jgi:hypothetical protein
MSAHPYALRERNIGWKISADNFRGLGIGAKLSLV